MLPLAGTIPQQQSRTAAATAWILVLSTTSHVNKTSPATSSAATLTTAAHVQTSLQSRWTRSATIKMQTPPWTLVRQDTSRPLSLIACFDCFWLGHLQECNSPITIVAFQESINYLGVIDPSLIVCRGNLLSTLIPPCQQLNTCLNDSVCYFVPDAALDNTACDDGFGFTDGDLCNDLGTCMPGPIIPCFLGDNNAPVLEMRSENPGTALKCETTRAEARLFTRFCFCCSSVSTLQSSRCISLSSYTTRSVIFLLVCAGLQGQSISYHSCK